MKENIVFSTYILIKKSLKKGYKALGKEFEALKILVLYFYRLEETNFPARAKKKMNKGLKV
jgi:hypothetical protein